MVVRLQTADGKVRRFPTTYSEGERESGIPEKYATYCGMEWKNALYLPQKTVLTGEKGKFVYIVEANNTVSPRPVSAGEWIGENILIESGISAGENIAADSLVKLKPGGEIIPNKH